MSSPTLFAKQQHTLSGYLGRYAEPEHFIAQAIGSAAKKAYTHCLVIPAFNEPPTYIERLAALDIANHHVLLITVINQPDTVEDTSENRALWNHLCEYTDSDNHHNCNNALSNTPATTPYLFKKISPHIDSLVIDRFTQPIPRKQGVGLARKIGGDIACQLIHSRVLQSPWIHFSDADTHLPQHYFRATDTLPEATNFSGNKKHRASDISSSAPLSYSAVVYPYTHTPSGDSQVDRATKVYEASLHYYVDQLRQAGSPYAYQTLGSCIASHAYHYSQVRGFPKRAGGEDFYLLNKLAKVGHIYSLSTPTLLIESRLSQRVPFGTGPAVEKIMQGSLENERIDYHPQCFIELASLLDHFNHIYHYKNDTQSNYHVWLNALSTPLQHALDQLNINALFLHIDKQINSHEQCLQHCHYWLDAFKTLKLIHLLTHTYPKTRVATDDQ